MNIEKTSIKKSNGAKPPTKALPQCTVRVSPMIKRSWEPQQTRALPSQKLAGCSFGITGHFKGAVKAAEVELGFNLYVGTHACNTYALTDLEQSMGTGKPYHNGQASRATLLLVPSCLCYPYLVP